MSKYFSNDSNVDRSQIISEPIESRAIPQPEPIHKTDLKTEQLITPTKIEEEILQVAAQSAIVNETMNEINRVNPNKIEDALKSFKPAELFERLNQITFIMIEMNNRLTTIEKSLQLDKHSENKIKKQSPMEQYVTKSNSKDNTIPDIDTVKRDLAKATSGKKVPGIPSEDYIDNGINLEEIFPEQSSEAIQAAYESMSENYKNVGGMPSKSPKGGSSGIVF